MIGRYLRRSTVLIVIFLMGRLLAQDVLGQPQASIVQLIGGLQQAVVNGSPVDKFFSPSARVNEKAKIDAFAAKGFLKFQIIGYTLKDLRLRDEEHASLPATVNWSTRTQEASKSTTLRFVREQGAWYFEQPDFWTVSVSWLFFPLIALAIAYGCGAVVMYHHSNRQHWVRPSRKNVWQALSIVPLLPFLYFHRKPWNAQ